MNDDLIGAALRALNTDPSASMAKIAAACGVSRATLHRRFAKREDLIVHLGREGLEVWQRAFEDSGIEQITAEGDAAAFALALRRMVSGYVEQAHSHGFALTETFFDQVPEMAERAKDLTDRETAVMRVGQQLGVLRPDVPAVWLGWSLFGGMVAARDALRWEEIGRRGLDDLVWTTFMNGAQA